ncbi:S8 family serine peptidase [bacterium]|mgnify:FL=1|nr:S8 family serine peptidase [bacterium]
MNRILTGVLALAISTQLIAKPVVDPALQARFLSKKDTDVTVIAKFKAQGPMNKRMRGMSPSQIQKQKMVIASISQQSLVNQISSLRKKTSDIKKTTSLWINNSMIITAKTSFIRSLAERDDLEKLDLDTELKLWDPIVRSAEKGINTEDSTYGLKKVQAMKVWSELGINGTGVTVGVLDTGVDSNHENLTGRVLATKDFVSDYADNAANDGHGHGTHCSGTIGGTNAGGKHIGVAPGVNFVVGKIFGDTGSTTVAAIMAGMQWITDPDGNPETPGPRVVSNSWGGPLNNRWQEIIDTWNAMGIIPVFAAGNSGPSAGTVGAPGAYKNVISIGATDANDAIARFSSRGPVTYAGETYIKPDVSAPGVDVYSAKPGGGYQNMSGTSMATPHTAGVVALMLQADPEISATRVSEILQETALELGDPGKDPAFGAGRINAFDAVKLVLTGGKAKVHIDSGDQIASVKVMPGNKTLHANANGDLTISLPAGTYELTISAFGYFAQTVEVTVVAKETVELSATLEQSPMFKVSFETQDSEGVNQNSNVSFVGVPVEGGSTNGGVLEVEAPGGNYTATIRTLGYQSATVNFSVSANTHVFVALQPLPEYLIIDHDSGKDYENFYTAAMGAAGLDFDIKEEIGADEIAGYQNVVWFTGLNSSATKIATADEQAMLTDYVANGGRLIISGQDVGYALKATSFYTGVIGANFVKDKSDVKTVSKEGLSFELDGGDSANNQKWPDVISVNEGATGATVLYTYEGQGPAIMSNVHGNGKVVYMAFGFEGINGEDNRNAVMGSLLDAARATTSEVLDRMEWAFHSNPHAYKAMVRNLKVTDENRDEIKTYLDGKSDKAPFRTVLQTLMSK